MSFRLYSFSGIINLGPISQCTYFSRFVGRVVICFFLKFIEGRTVILPLYMLVEKEKRKGKVNFLLELNIHFRNLLHLFHQWTSEFFAYWTDSFSETLVENIRVTKDILSTENSFHSLES